MCCRPSSAGSATRPERCRWCPPTTVASAAGRRRRRCYSSAKSATRTERSPQGSIRAMLTAALADTGLTDPATGGPLRFTPHDFRRLFITDAILNGLPPHIAQVIAGHRDINVTLGYKVYPDEAIQAHLAFLGRRRALRPSEEYRVPTDEEWTEFVGHFERRKVSIGTCGRAFGTPCIHEHACVCCPMLWPDPGPTRPARRDPRQARPDRPAQLQPQPHHRRARHAHRPATVEFAMILADAWSAVGGIAAVVAAGAALITIWYARATVGEARAARREASDAHTEEMAEQRSALQASTAAHQEQMRERERALATEIKLQRIVQLERVAEVLTDLADTAG